MSGDTEYGLLLASERCLHATVSVNPEQARRAVLTWAKTLGWCPLPTPGDGLVFAVAREALFTLHYELAIYIAQHEDGLVGIEFVSSGPAATSEYYENYLLMAETFAQGVCSQLAAQGATVDPPYLGRSTQKLGRTRILIRSLRITELTLYGLAIPCALSRLFLSARKEF